MSESRPDDESARKRHRTGAVPDFPYRTTFATKNGFIVRDPADLDQTRVDWDEFIRGFPTVDPADNYIEDQIKRLLADHTTGFGDQAREVVRMGLDPERQLGILWRLAIRYDSRIYQREREWSERIKSRTFRKRMQEVNHNGMAEHDDVRIIASMARAHLRSRPKVSLFRLWKRGMYLPNRLFNERIPSDIDVHEYCGPGPYPDTASTAASLPLRLGPLNHYTVLYSVLHEFEGYLPVLREKRIWALEAWAKKETDPWAGDTDTDLHLFWYRLAHGGGVPGTGLNAGLPPVQDVRDQVEAVLKDADVLKVSLEYTQASYEILDVIRSQFDDRRDKSRLHSQRRIDQSNTLLRSIYKAPHSRTPLTLFRFQNTRLTGWRELDAWFHGTDEQKKKAHTDLFQTWRPSNTILSTSWNLEFAFKRRAGLYIIYHVHPDCHWLWIPNESGEDEILLPPGLVMRAIRATIAETRDGQYVYVLEAIVRHRTIVPPYDKEASPNPAPYKKHDDEEEASEDDDDDDEPSEDDSEDED